MEQEMSEKITVGSLAERFEKIYDLSRESKVDPLNDLRVYDQVRHDMMHVMTGFDIGIADELRVAVCEVSLRDSWRNGSGEAARRAQELYRDLTEEMKIGWKHFNSRPNSLETEEFYQTQIGTQPLEESEILELHKLGLRLRAAIERLTGKPYLELSTEEIARLDFYGVDFVAEAHAIKDKYQKPENRAVEERTADIFNAAARAKGRGEDLMPPAAGVSWNKAARTLSPAGA